MEPLQTLHSPISPLRAARSASARLISRSGRENNPPPHPNLQIDRSSLHPSRLKKSSPVEREIPRSDGPPDSSSVKVVVRIRPVNGHEKAGGDIFSKVTSDSLSISDKNFTFDSVLGPQSSQEDVFNLVGIPLVHNALAGYNASIVSYGQTGSGKTYTMWGPQSAMLDACAVDSSLGLVPRIFQMLFSEIRKKQECAEARQINYQCRCSFLEIYHEQINDLLDPGQRDLKIRDDVKNGLYVENLTDEYVSNVEDVSQILVKGLSNRKVGATSVNSKSSQSHIIFTCTVESWCKESQSEYITSSKISRISLVDLAGLDINKPNGAGKCIGKDGRHVKQSLSKLGKTVSVLSDDAHSGEYQKIQYMDSCLTHLLKESLGGNAKVTYMCSISPEERHRAGTLSTLRFGSRARFIQNNAVINEISEDHVNVLSNQIRQLKEELIREKLHGGNSITGSVGYFHGCSARESLNQLRVSLNRSLILPHIEIDLEEEMDVDEDDMKELCTQLHNVQSAEDDAAEELESINSIPTTEEGKCQETKPEEELHLEVPESEMPGDDSSVQIDTHFAYEDLSSGIRDSHLRDHPKIITGKCFPLHDPTLSESPKTGKNLKKGIMASSYNSGSRPESPRSNVVEMPSKNSRDSLRASLQSSKVSPTESLSASLHRGLQIINYHQRSPASRKPFLGLSFDHFATTSRQTVDRVDAAAQTSPNDLGTGVAFLCSACKKVESYVTGIVNNSNMEIMPGNAAETSQESNAQVLLLLDCDHKANPQASIGKYELQSEIDKHSFDSIEREALLEEIQSLKNQLKSYTTASTDDDSLLEQIRMGYTSKAEGGDQLVRMREKWTESESRWICLTEELRQDLESKRLCAERKEFELSMEKKCSAELDDALQRAILGYARIIEHYVELQEKHDDLHGRHRKVMEGVAEVKKAAQKAGAKGKGSAFAEALAAELSTLRIEKEKERAHLKKQNKELKIQLRDTAEAVHAAGELLVRLREAEEAVSLSEEKRERTQQENEKLRKQMEKLKRKHAMEMVTMKHYLAESRLPESALEPFYHQESEIVESRASVTDDDHSWRAAFRPAYE